MTAEPEPQDVEEAREHPLADLWQMLREAWDNAFFGYKERWGEEMSYGYYPNEGDPIKTRIESAIRADERARWAEREKELVEALRPFAELTTCYCDEFWLHDYHRHGPNCFWADYAEEIATARAVLNQERPS